MEGPREQQTISGTSRHSFRSKKEALSIGRAAKSLVRDLGSPLRSQYTG